MGDAYQTYLSLMSKGANLFINAERSPLLSEKLLGLRMRNFERAGGTVRHDTLVGMMGGGHASIIGTPAAGNEIHIPSTEGLKYTQHSPAANRLFTHHELDEVAVGHQLSKQTLYSEELKAYMSSPAEGAEYFKDREAPFGAAIHNTAGKPLGLMPIGHVDPAVILRESNRVQHELSPVDKAQQILMRQNTSGDAAQYTFPYGNKYIPENGREFASQQRVARTKITPVLPPDLAASRNKDIAGKAYHERKIFDRKLGTQVADLVKNKQIDMPHLHSNYGKTVGDIAELQRSAFGV